MTYERTPCVRYTGWQNGAPVKFGGRGVYHLGIMEL